MPVVIYLICDDNTIIYMPCEWFGAHNNKIPDILIEEEKPLPGRSGEMAPGFLDLQVLDTCPGTDEEPEPENQPPEPRIFCADYLG